MRELHEMHSVGAFGCRVSARVCPPAQLALGAALLAARSAVSQPLAAGSAAALVADASPGLSLARFGLLLLLAAGVAVTLFLVLRVLKHGAARYNRYRAVLEQSPHGLVIADATSLAIVDANPALLRALGYSLTELRKLRLHDIFVDDAAYGDAFMGRLLAPDAEVPIRLRERGKNGDLLVVEATGQRLMLGRRAVLAFTTTDMTMRRRVEEELLEKQQHLDHLAHHDQLTGLPNRLYLAHRLPGAIEEAKRAGRMLAVLFLDLDRFKHINDSRGHETGDKLLKTVAERVRGCVRADDIVVRMGGDEFIVVLQSVERIEVISETAARINQAMGAPVIVDGRPLVTTVSIGVSLFPRDGSDMGELLRHSDTAMYQAKDRGRNNVQLFSPIMARKIRERVAVEASLRAALERGELDVHYQPIIDIASNKVMALEALLRWKHPTQGYILPGRFIDIAEETGLIVPVGEFVLQKAVEDVSRWRASGATLVPIAVNISAVQLQRSNLRDKIVALTSAHGVSPSLLQLELTESAMFERRESRGGESRHDAISQLRDLGVRIAIDDFGTGYSSLSYLKQWHVDYLKIDRSFVRDLVTDMSDLAIVGAIVAIARHLNVKVVAEGIEGWQQLEKLRQLGCGLAQGYLFAKPAPAAQVRKLLRGEPIDLTDTDVLMNDLHRRVKVGPNDLSATGT
ncbi:MAG TPA: EAL domain-containing protein [Steroidobacteraceae bacterium]|nr:EAL domain-containing protein [Steroidobacteraceae bacterium]